MRSDGKDSSKRLDSVRDVVTPAEESVGGISARGEADLTMI